MHLISEKAVCTLTYPAGLLLIFVAFSLYQMTPLHSAAERGRNTIVVHLIDQGADVDIRDNNEVNTIITDSSY